MRDIHNIYLTHRSIDKRIGDGGNSKWGSVQARLMRIRSAIGRIHSATVFSMNRHKRDLTIILRLRRDMLDADEGKRKWYMRRYGLSIQELNELALACLRKMKQAKEAGPRDYNAKSADIEQALKARDAKDLHTKHMLRVAKFNKKV